MVGFCLYFMVGGLGFDPPGRLALDDHGHERGRRSFERLLHVPQHLSRVQGSGFRVQGAGCRVEGAGVRVEG